jgi:hypothetical protein
MILTINSEHFPIWYLRDGLFNSEAVYTISIDFQKFQFTINSENQNPRALCPRLKPILLFILISSFSIGYIRPAPVGNPSVMCSFANTLSDKWRMSITNWLKRNRKLQYGVGKNFHFSMSSRQSLGPTQSPIQWVPGALSSGAKRPGREADHSPPTSAEFKKTWVYTSTPLYVFMV